MEIKKKPLSRSITIGCSLFIVLLCVVLGIMNYLGYKEALYNRYEAYITNILKYTESFIDNDDLKNCVDTGVESEKFYELRDAMDREMEEFDIHYLYAVKPLNTDPTKNVMSVISAENYKDRNSGDDDLLWLGWISDDEFDVRTVEKFFEIMNSEGITFFEEKTEWGIDYTGATALRTSSGEPYAVLAVDVDINEINKVIISHVIKNSVVILVIGVLFMVGFLVWAQTNVTEPITKLENSVVKFASNSHGQRDINALNFVDPDIHTHNEVETLSNAVRSMTEDMKDYVKGIATAEEIAADMQIQANYMNELANKDILTGIRNKNAYEQEIAGLNELVESGKARFGIAMIDLNFLKTINDNYGHEKGDNAIKRLSAIVCDVFSHSPVFRIGGDEFAIILMGNDYENIEMLMDLFKEKMIMIENDDDLNEWDKISAAIGYAIYDKNIDENVNSVFRRADENMYKNKKMMKAVRE
ncbi:GGDEF domain-containing protein [Butyrivibrio sp. WCE2006]|uniref:GGDEF domain-containing protein n=1 Tax=Butyrivibrio sp. WCE2006 TaxID=1410611 RepID=UPI000679D257|nr:GGDEF domain-containing protein [Butyrivibrio sp. WCE2006]